MIFTIIGCIIGAIFGYLMARLTGADMRIGGIVLTSGTIAVINGGIFGTGIGFCVDVIIISRFFIN
ncbi:hypothetical protein c7_L1184 [Megavirus courdo7]|uniref:Uncharacterized protein n=1 Tax=Megavirus courdo7 TaxID=1128135 RepID=H2ECA8_9VIRU|nr:hypothetical protein c7_L1184 [Megavirus courdo7]